jgi:hypothetical protein
MQNVISACRLLVRVEARLGIACEPAEKSGVPSMQWPQQPPRSMMRAPSTSMMRPGGAICRSGEVTVVRHGDGCQLRFTVPAVVQRGAELGRIARIVIAAQERADRSEGLGA